MPVITTEKVIISDDFRFNTSSDIIYGFDAIPSNALVEDLISGNTNIKGGGNEIPFSRLWNSENDILTTVFRPNCYIRNNLICIDLDYTKLYKYNSLVLVYYSIDTISKTNIIANMNIALIVSIKDYVNQVTVQDLNDYSHNFLYIDLNFLPSFNRPGVANKIKPLPYDSPVTTYSIPFTATIDHLHTTLLQYQTYNNFLIDSLDYITSVEKSEVDFYPENRSESAASSTNLTGTGTLLSGQYYYNNDLGEAAWITNNSNIPLYLQNSKINKEYSNVVQFDDLPKQELSSPVAY